MVASVCHFGYSRSSGLAHDRVFLMTSPFSDSMVFSVYTGKQRFQKASFSNAPVWRAFSNGSVFDDRFRHCNVDNGRIQSLTAPFSFENGLVWTGAK